MTNFVLINLMNTLHAYVEKKLPQKISYAITRNIMNITREYQIYESQLKKIFDEYSEYMIKDDKGEIHYHQICGLNEWDKYDGTICGFIIEFRECEKTIFLNIKDFNKLVSKIDKKSFNLKDIDTYKINHIVIPQKLLKTKYSYDIDYFIKNTDL